MTLVKRHLSFRFKLADGQGSFNSNGDDTFEVSGVRASALIEKAGGRSMTSLSAKIYGLPPDVMNKLTLLGKPFVDNRSNTVIVTAGDENTGDAVVFVGTIKEAWIDPRSMPQVAFIVSAFSGLIPAMKPIPPTSYKGSVDAALAVSGVAQQMGYVMENSGVNAQISDVYLPGTALQQLEKLATAGGFNCIVEDTEAGGVVAIWPKDGVRGGERILVSPDTGMVGYPMRTEYGIEVMTLFNPSAVFGGMIEVDSSFTPAKGGWRVAVVNHDLEAETPGGKWFTTIGCYLLGQEAPNV